MSDNLYDYAINNLIDFGFEKLSNNKDYVTREDIKERYKFSDRDLDIIMNAFDPHNTNQIPQTFFRETFKLIIKELYNLK